MDTPLDRACDHRSFAMSGHFRGNWSSTSNSTAANPTTAKSIPTETDNSNQSNRYKINQHKSETGQQGQSIKSNREIHDYDRICRVDPITRQQVDGYAQLVIGRTNDGWSCHLLTFPFIQLPGPRGAVIQAMKGELQRVYSTFVTRTHRKPRSTPSDELPVLIGAADLPVYKKDSRSSPLVLCNGGLHFHGLLMVPPDTRLDVPVEEHFREYQDMYLGKRRLITKLDVRPVTETHERAVDYLFKTILRGRVSYDDGVLVLPRTRDELGPSRTGFDPLKESPSLLR
jgi:hypothetical protein